LEHDADASRLRPRQQARVSRGDDPGSVDEVLADVGAFGCRLEAAFERHSAGVSAVVDDQDAVLLHWHEALRDLRSNLNPVSVHAPSVAMSALRDYAAARPWASASALGEAGALEVLAA
jgi:hypothetical protein